VTKRLSLTYDNLPSNIAFNFHLRRYTLGGDVLRVESGRRVARLHMPRRVF